MEISVIVLPIFILLVLLVVAIPVIMGIYIYKDANRRGMNAALWTLVGILAPGFIGLIIYLIVRGEHPDLQCFSCGKPVSSEFSVCPFCGAPLKEKCGNCGYTLNAEWVVCASCGTEIPEEQRGHSTVRKKGGGLKWLLALVIAVPLILMVLLFAATCLFTYKTDMDSISYECHDIPKSAIYEDQQELLDWISACDAQGEGAYVLRTDYRMGAMTITNLLIYRNDGYHETSTSSSSGGWFVSPELEVDYYTSGFDSRQDYTLTAYCIETNSDKSVDISLFDTDYDGNRTELGCVITESGALDCVLTQYFNEDYIMDKMYLTVGIDEYLTGVYSISADLYLDDMISEGETVQNAHKSDMAGQIYNFMHYAELDQGIYSLVVTLFDENEAELFRTEPIPLSEDMEWDALICFYFDEDLNSIAYDY